MILINHMNQMLSSQKDCPFLKLVEEVNSRFHQKSRFPIPDAVSNRKGVQHLPQIRIIKL